MRIPFIAGNWKMNTSLTEAVTLAKGLKSAVSDIHKVDVAICPPFPFLFPVAKELAGSAIQLGAQNMYWEKKGAFTGETAASMLKDVGCSFVILGHSERRHVFGEKDDGIHKKILAALDAGLNPIVCVGETLEERENGKTEQVVESQIHGCLSALSKESMLKVTIAYEPVWAIGTGKTATPEQAQEVHRLIRMWLERQFDRETAETIRIQYGGSVKAENAAELLAQSDIDGALVGGASLKVDDFAAILRAGSST